MRSLTMIGRALGTVLTSGMVLMAAGMPASAQETDRLSVTVRAGLLQMSGGGDVLRVASRHLTLDDSSFDTGLLALEIFVRPGVGQGHLDLLAGVEMGRTTAASTTAPMEFAGDPVAQTSTLNLGPGGYVGARLRLLPPEGRRFNILLTGAAGIAQYEFRQEGLFRDHRNGQAFQADFGTDGAYGFAVVGGGIEVGIASRTSVIADVRVRAGNASPEGDYADLSRLDLGGIQFSVGFTRAF